MIRFNDTNSWLNQRQNNRINVYILEYRTLTETKIFGVKAIFKLHAAGLINRLFTFLKFMLLGLT